MVRINVITFYGIIGANLHVHSDGVADQVVLLFRLDMARTAGEKQAIATIAEVIRQAKLDWIEPRTGRWVIHLDALKEFAAVTEALTNADWFQGKAEVEPILRVPQMPPAMPGIGVPLPASCYVALLIRPEDAMQKFHDVFISYSWDDEPYKTWVRELAARLRTDGVRAILDHWETAPGDQLSCRLLEFVGRFKGG